MLIVAGVVVYSDFKVRVTDRVEVIAVVRILLADGAVTRARLRVEGPVRSLRRVLFFRLPYRDG